MELIFYKGPGGWLDWGIRLRTAGPYSHVELRFEENLMFSSSWLDGGVRFKDKPVRPENWDRLAIDVDGATAEKMLWWCSKRKAAKYDLVGIFSFFSILGRSYEDADRWHCSEISGACLTKHDLLEVSRKVSPNSLYAQAVRTPEVFQPVTGEFQPRLTRPYLQLARDKADSLLNLDPKQREREIYELSLDEPVLYSLVMMKLNEE